MRAPSREKCIFCSSPADSDEDVFPEWLLKTVGQDAMILHRTGKESKKTDSLRVKARVVCETCNNEWMSRIEQATKPVLQPMLQGHGVVLGRVEQEHLARWAVKVSMLVEHLHGKPEDEMYWTEAERAAFAKPPHARPSKESQVFLGTYTGTAWTARLGGGRRAITAISGDTPLAFSAQFTIICKSVMFHVISDKYEATTGRVGWIWPPPHFDRLDALAEDLDKVAWPQAKTLGELELDEYLAGKRAVDVATAGGPEPVDQGPGESQTKSLTNSTALDEPE